MQENKNTHIYLDNSATTPLSAAAREKIVDMLDVFGNPSSLHAAGDTAALALRAARRAVLLTLGVRSMSDEHFHGNARGLDCRNAAYYSRTRRIAGVRDREPCRLLAHARKKSY